MLHTRDDRSEQLAPSWLIELLRLPWALFATIWIALAIRLINIDALPGEFYGDIAIVHDYVADVLAGQWPSYFVLSAGPLYHYLIAPIVFFVGDGYLGLKLASVIVSLGVLAVTYGLAREVGDARLALVTTFIAGVGSWLLVFSRLGNSQILVPLLAVGSLWLAIRTARYGTTANVIGCAVVAALGLYTYPQSFVLPPVIGLTLLLLGWTYGGVMRRHIVVFAITTLLCALPFVFIVARDPANFFTGYIGGKLDNEHNAWATLITNVWHGLLAFNLRGDIVFRSNPVRLPHLDPVSGIFFLIGLIVWLLPRQRQIGIPLVITFVLLQVPSWLVLSNPNEVPSASRSLGVAPLAYLFAASGLLWLVKLIKLQQPLLRSSVIVIALLAILLLNVDRYFDRYAAGLPNGNTPFGRIIAEYIATLPPHTKPYVVGCCWGAWGQPELSGIRFAFDQIRPIQFLKTDGLTCATLDNLPRPAEIIWSPHAALPSAALEECTMKLDPLIHLSERGDPIFHSATITARP